jgi:hypothetical protein
MQVANELAAAKIPVILTANRDAQDTWEKRNSLPGPPLSKSPAAILAEAGVLFGLAIPGEGKPFFSTFASYNFPPQRFCFKFWK